MENWTKGSTPSEEGNYYVNGSTTRVLCWQDGKWFMVLVKQGYVTGYIQPMLKQPRVSSFMLCSKPRH
jgi:hypothetical protein